MRSRIWSVLCAVLAAAILAGGYAAIPLGDRLLTKEARTVTLPGDESAADIRRFDKGLPLQLYPFDEYDSAQCVPLAKLEGVEVNRQEFNKRLFVRLCERLTAELVLTDGVPDFFGALVQQQSNGLCYLVDFPVEAMTGGKPVTRLLNAAFDADFSEYSDYMLFFYVSLTPPETETDVDVEAAARRMEQGLSAILESKSHHEVVDEVEIDTAPAERPLYEGEAETEQWEEVWYWLWETMMLPFDDGEFFCKSYECILYGETVLFVLQDGSAQVVLQYSPAIDEFFGISLRPPY